MGNELEQQLDVLKTKKGIDLTDRAAVRQAAERENFQLVIEAIQSISHLKESKRSIEWGNILRETMSCDAPDEIENGLDADDTPDPTETSTESSDSPSEAETSEKPVETEQQKAQRERQEAKASTATPSPSTPESQEPDKAE